MVGADRGEPRCPGRPVAHRCARWLTGELELQPRYFGAATDPETVPLVQTLAAVNRAGFWTDMSQPGLVDGELRQRAYVAGYCRPEVAERLEVLGLTDVVVLACAAEVPGSFDVPITVQGYDPHTWGARGGESPGEFAGELHPTAVAALSESVHVEVLDPHWGQRPAVGRAGPRGRGPTRQ